jgi:hypothetical protein
MAKGVVVGLGGYLGFGLQGRKRHTSAFLPVVRLDESEVPQVLQCCVLPRALQDDVPSASAVPCGPKKTIKIYQMLAISHCKVSTKAKVAMVGMGPRQGGGYAGLVTLNQAAS